MVPELFLQVGDVPLAIFPRAYKHQANERKHHFCYQSHLPLESAHRPAVRRAAPITGAQLYFPHRQCYHDTLSKLHQQGRAWAGTAFSLKPSTTTSLKMLWNGTENKEEGTIFQNILVSLQLCTSPFSKLSGSPAKLPVLSVSFQKREKSRGILLASLSKFWWAQVGTACTDQWRLSSPYQEWLSLDVSSGAHLPILRAPKAFES